MTLAEAHAAIEEAITRARERIEDGDFDRASRCFYYAIKVVRAMKKHAERAEK